MSRWSRKYVTIFKNSYPDFCSFVCPLYLLSSGVSRKSTNAPGKKRDMKKRKGKNGNFSLNLKSGVVKGSSGSNIKKAKDKAVPKRKLKDQTTKWIEDVNKSFNELQPKLAEDNAHEKKAAQKEAKICIKKEERINSLKSDITDAEVSNTITNMANLLEQT